MINSRSKTIKYRFCIHPKINDSQPYHSFHPQRHTTKSPPPRERPQKPTRNYLRKPIPFITNIKQIRDPDQALSLFYDYHRTGLKHDYPSYCALIYKLARSRNFEAVETLLTYIQHNNIRCRDTLFIALIQHYGKSQLVHKAIELFHEMGSSYNCFRTIQSFNTLLNVLIDSDRFCDADDMFKCLPKMGLRPNSVSYNILIKGWLKKGEWEKACRVFDEMREREVETTVVTYNSQIGFLCKRGDFDKAKSLFEEMKQKRKHPNAITYALLMEGLCSLGKYMEAQKMMFDMEYQGCKPRLVNYGVLMTDLGKRGNVDEVKAFLVEMKKRRIKPDVVTYNILINYLSKGGRTAEAYKTLVDMQVKGCEPNAATYRMVVDSFCRDGEFEEGLKVLNAMLMSRHCPRFETFFCLIQGLIKVGKIDDASFVLEEMQKRNIGFDLESWEALVGDACDPDESVSGLVTELVSAN